MLSELIIGTTAINRPPLHTNIFYGWLKWLAPLALSQNIKLTWFINIDIIEKLPFTYEETQKNIQNILIEHKLDKIYNVYFLKSETGNFLNACKRIGNAIIHYVFDNKIMHNKLRIMWLEDDWKFNDHFIEKIDINYLINTLSINRTHINLTFIRNNYIWALAPSIIDYELWIDIYYKAWMCQLSNADPEYCAGNYYIKMYGSVDDIYNITVIWRKEQPKYLKRAHINYKNSLYMLIDENENSELIDIDKRYISKERFKKTFGKKNTFIRITPTFCIDGVNYGRDFMKKYELTKTHVQTDENTDFYK
jgi:hypothetical protein